jgi:hypothetical protein
MLLPPSSTTPTTDPARFDGPAGLRHARPQTAWQLERDVAAMADDLRADLDQLLLEAGQQPRFRRLRRVRARTIRSSNCNRRITVSWNLANRHRRRGTPALLIHPAPSLPPNPASSRREGPRPPRCNIRMTRLERRRTVFVTDLVDGRRHASPIAASAAFPASIPKSSRRISVSATGCSSYAPCPTGCWLLGERGLADGVMQSVIKGPSGAGVGPRHFRGRDRVADFRQHKFQGLPVLTRGSSIPGGKFRLKGNVRPCDTTDMLGEGLATPRNCCGAAG